MGSVRLVTYLTCVCAGSVALIVFLNATTSFVVTDVLHVHDRIGDAVGTLVFADEITVLCTVPFWGLLSDTRIGAEKVVVLGYLMIGAALFLFVHVGSVYPGLLLVRILFAVGAACLTCMLSALLPTVITSTSTDTVNSDGQARPTATNNGSSCAPTPQASKTSQGSSKDGNRSATRMAGLAGFCTCCGALLSVLLFLRLPAWLQENRESGVDSLRTSYYIIGSISFLLALTCAFGLRAQDHGPSSDFEPRQGSRFSIFHHGRFVFEAAELGFRDRTLALAYVGGFVARASSIGITAFVPLFINDYFISQGICDRSGRSLQDLKEQCPRAYLLAAELTGISQLAALLCALVFGFISGRLKTASSPLLVAGLAGIVGYLVLGLLGSKMLANQEITAVAVMAMVLIGVSQIGSIVCSLGLLSEFTLHKNVSPKHVASNAEIDQGRPDTGADECTPILGVGKEVKSYEHMKGSIAGAYSFSGGCGILLLSKLGGFLFEKSREAPFFILLGFNLLLVLLSFWHMAGERKQPTELSTESDA